MPEATVHIGWRDDNLRVQDDRRPFDRRVKRLLRVEDMSLIIGLPSELRMAAGIETRSYYTYPLLFYTAFPDISLAQLQSLSVAGSYLFDYILCLDSILDHPTLCNTAILFLSGMLQREALSLLYPLFPADAPFWRYFDLYYEHFVQAILRERARHHCLVTPYAEDALRFIYSGKPAVAKACIAALGLLAGREDLIERFTASHDAFYVAFQLLDDLQDWRLDYQRRHYSYPLTDAFIQAGWQERVESEQRPGIAEVEDTLGRSGAVERSLALAMTYLDRAEQALAGNVDNTWAAAIEQTRRNVQRFRLNEPPPNAPAPASQNPLNWDAEANAPAAPVAERWLTWLDHSRPPHIDDARILDAQREHLKTAGGASTLGEALCCVGQAVAASYRQYPDRPLAVHLGLSTGEFEWCLRNEQWLNAIVALHLDDPPRLWSMQAAPASDVFPGCVPPAAGRFMGYRLVEDYAGGALRAGELDIAQVLGHYRHQLIT